VFIFSGLLSFGIFQPVKKYVVIDSVKCSTEVEFKPVNHFSLLHLHKIHKI